MTACSRPQEHTATRYTLIVTLPLSMSHIQPHPCSLLSPPPLIHLTCLTPTSPPHAHPHIMYHPPHLHPTPHPSHLHSHVPTLLTSTPTCPTSSPPLPHAPPPHLHSHMPHLLTSTPTCPTSSPPSHPTFPHSPTDSRCYAVGFQLRNDRGGE